MQLCVEVVSTKPAYRLTLLPPADVKGYKEDCDP